MSATICRCGHKRVMHRTVLGATANAGSCAVEDCQCEGFRG